MLREVGAEVICLQEDDYHQEALQALSACSSAAVPTAAGSTGSGGGERTESSLPSSSKKHKKNKEHKQNIHTSSLPPSPSSAAYAGRWKKRTGAEKADGVSIFWQVQKFKLVESEEVEYLVSGCDYLDRDNVALVVVLQEREGEGEGEEGREEGEGGGGGGGGGGEGGRKLIVANTHLLFNPRRGDVKLAQLQLLLARVERLQQRHPGAGIGTS